MKDKQTNDEGGEVKCAPVCTCTCVVDVSRMQTSFVALSEVLI